mmetsp:Transcript_38842/g.121347  ORF Transcript_38842/g.121347 Transcript_38842/m.121347 type:complete len:223 (-) Transcript_38842:306-974(-)
MCQQPCRHGPRGLAVQREGDRQTPRVPEAGGARPRAGEGPVPAWALRLLRGHDVLLFRYVLFALPPLGHVRRGWPRALLDDARCLFPCEPGVGVALRGLRGEARDGADPLSQACDRWGWHAPGAYAHGQSPRDGVPDDQFCGHPGLFLLLSDEAWRAPQEQLRYFLGHAPPTRWRSARTVDAASGVEVHCPCRLMRLDSLNSVGEPVSVSEDESNSSGSESD